MIAWERPMTRRVLFICTGNFYRSRFAEAVFNYHAAREMLPWSAFSRGLATHLVEGDLSPYAAEALRELGIGLEHTGRTRIQLCEADLAGAHLRIALKESEHRPLIIRLFPQWEPEIRFWDVSDIDGADPQEALLLIEGLVLEFLADLRSAETGSHRSCR